MVNSNFPDVQMLVSSFSHLSPSIEPVVGVEPSVGGSVVLMTEAEVPLAYHVRPVAQRPQLLGQQCEVGKETYRLHRLDGTVLPAGVDGIPASQQGGPCRSADW